MMARVPYVREEEIPEEHQHMIGSQTVRRGEDMHILQAIANNRSLLGARRKYGAALRRDSGLTERERELVILIVANHLKSSYLWHQHIRFAVDSLLSKAEINALSTRNYDQFSDAETVLLQYVLRFADRSIDDNLHTELAAFYDDETIVGIGMLTMGYVGLVLGIDGFDVDIEEDEFVGWNLEAV
jgi:4-carboxymuconolactone decarboxylase